MMPLLAEASPGFTPEHLAGWLGIVAFVIMLTNGIFTLVQNVKGRPSPAEVQMEGAKTFATKTEVAAIEAKIDEHVRQSAVSRARIYDKIEATRVDIDGKINLLPSQIVNQLSVLGVLVRPNK